MKVNPSLPLDFVNSLGFATLACNDGKWFNDGKSDIFLKDELFTKTNEQTEDLN